VAKGYSQVKDVDYQDTFAPTANFTSVRVLMQLAAQHDLVLHQMDVKTAYLNAPIDCETFIEQPEGFVVDSGCDSDSEQFLNGTSAQNRPFQCHYMVLRLKMKYT